jgi:hypothetical protein
MEKITREFVVERHAVTSVVLYEVTGEDLELLEQETIAVGEDFSFALASLSVALSFTITLRTVAIPAGKTYEVFGLLCSWAIFPVFSLASGGFVVGEILEV